MLSKRANVMSKIVLLGKGDRPGSKSSGARSSAPPANADPLLVHQYISRYFLDILYISQAIWHLNGKHQRKL
jgi:hypothetical protein